MKKFAIASGLVLAMGLATGAQAHPENAGYWDESPTSTVWKTGTGGCWRHGFWEESDAIEGCEGYKAPMAEAPAPAPAPAPKMMSTVEKHIVYFDFDSSNPGDVSDISSYVNSLKEVTSVNLVGHADRIGASAYNDALSQKRVNAVAKALQAGGVSASVISTGYMGENAPAKSCEGLRGTNVVDCLRANRRVEVEISGKK
ncbi:OmpA family protein [Neptuniibacter pectenicola]|jgi:OOP family OmpA-OmpF porin|uniref:OmpA family protein n=1 Tax=Neptuniibacter pectenicola TaxID=1806669 RepID=A0ABU9TME5_9GAMM|nr:OmpA family protein [Neptuniibacter pectenicola]|tara:strand:+ start:3531 stop:4130 length:600 start_codon:yes stop_codon:yes gene_type:complete|eukprot:gnl/Carplike_NY0171/1602_a2164_730.p1 GENE.gnl/Carplike_NY0171/1602_a2164_730~~gnl/Carplike_NY0171/1602_a2164_730.p1  ORF type:complete len:200 (-),score=25.73 gnl/Carplike_NY0171/1602_a2164_730:557-1156(-)